MRVLRRSIGTMAWLGGIWLVLCGAAGILAVEGALHPVRLPLLPANAALAQSIAEQDGAQAFRLACERIERRGPDAEQASAPLRLFMGELKRTYEFG